MAEVAADTAGFNDQQDYYLASAVIVAALCIYVYHYITDVIEKPVLYASGQFCDFLKRHCIAVHTRYVPPVFLHNNYVQSVLRAILQTKPRVDYEREYLEVEDGKLTLDWVIPKGSDENTPIVLILPGMTGSNDTSYVRHFVRIITGQGYCALVFTSRGNGNSAVESPRLHHAAYTDDVESLMDHLHRKIHNRPIMAIAVSMGGCILGNYMAKCHKRGKPSGLSAVLFVSTGWNVHHCMTVEVERPLTKFIINKHLLKTAKRVVRRHIDILNAHYPELVKNCLKTRTMREFDNAITAPIFGFEDADDYYRNASLHEKIDALNVPLLCVLAADDPIFPKCSIPFEEIAKNPKIAILLTKRGGHIGHICLFFPTLQRNFVDIVVDSYVRSVFQNFEEFRKCTAAEVPVAEQR